ncbi:helix-turn-helix domain-containing protein [Lacticaseibacillus jixianensis]|uniref:Helix-turn-helix domain-containing protein n=1 Tax=Lacticaseibacillus jixianensis TaxID=2486012 RepID=A0ABW4B513_9LACO|nr:AraC family transcriptional regulator [Lacticaseibacillus jixianensis]
MAAIKHEIVQMTPSFPFRDYLRRPARMAAVAPHWHQGLEVNCLIHGGTLKVVEDGRTSLFTPGCMWAIDPRVVHSSSAEQRADWLEYGFNVDPEFLTEVLPDAVNWHFTLHGQPADPAQRPAYEALWTAMLAMSQEHGRAGDQISRLRMLSAFYRVLALLAAHFTAPLQTPAVRVNPPLVDAAMGIIDRDYAEPLTTARLAQRLHVSTTTLNAQFQANLKLSVIRYLRTVRLMKARELLLTSNKAIDYVATAVGFANQRALARNFKGWKGLTPSAYRKAYKRFHKNDRVYF